MSIERGRGFREHGPGVMTPLVVAHSFEVWLPLTMTWAYNQLRYAEGTEAIVLAGATANRDRFPWEPVYSSTSRLERSWMRAVRRAGRRAHPRAFECAFRDYRPRVLHSHFGYRGWADLPLARRRGPAHVVSFYGHDVTMFPRTWPEWRRRYRELFAAADLILCEGPFMAGSIVGLGCPEGKVRVQRLGVELDRLPFEPRVLPADEAVRVLVAGAFRPKKGIPAALEAVATARSGGRALVVTVVGGSNGSAVEEAERERIEQTVCRFGLADVVSFRGMLPYDRLLGELRSHHIFLSPSVTAQDGDSEGGAPVTIIEAAATGMPVVSTVHCDIPEVVRDGVTGFLAPEGDQAGLDRCLARALDASSEWPSIGRAAASMIRERFDVRACALELVAAYRDAVALRQS